MASLALGLVGAGIGSLAPAGFTFLGMTGAGLGWSIGSTLGGILFAPDGPNTQGPRLSDLSVQSSTRGAPIPTVYGTQRIAGNVIWTSGLIEKATTEEVGGKGGPSSSHTSFTYSASFAVGLCEEIGGVSRIWADGNLIYDTSSGVTAESIIASSGIDVKIYLGTETQEPDPTMEAYLGSGNVPAHRGLSYVVFTNLELGDYGNRIPNLTFQVSSSPRNDTGILDGGVFNVPLPNIDQVKYRPIGYGYNVTSADFPDSKMGLFWGPLGIETNGYYVEYDMDISTSTHNYITVYYLNAGPIDSATRYSGITQDYMILRNESLGYATLYKIDRDNQLAQYKGKVYIDVPKTAWLYGEDVYGPTHGNNFIQIGSRLYFGVNWTAYGINGRIFSFDASALPDVAADIYSDISTPPGEITGDTTGNHEYRMYATQANDRLYVYSYNHTISPRILEYDTELNLLNTYLITIPYCSAFAIENDKLWTVKYNTSLSKLELSVFSWPEQSLLQEFTSLSVGAAKGGSAKVIVLSDTVAFAKAADALVVGIQAGDHDSVLLRDIITDLCDRSGIAACDTSSVTDLVHGFVRANPMTARAAIEPLLSAFQVGAVETDYSLTFKPLTGTPVESIAENDFTGDLSITRALESELPRRVTVGYADQDADYLPAIQSAQRIKTAGQIVNEVSQQFPIASNGPVMSPLSEKILYRAWTERESFDWSLSPKHTYLDAGDVVELVVDGAAHITRITSENVQLPGVMQCSGVATRASIYSSALAGVSSSYIKQMVALVGNTLFEIIDCPALRDADTNTAGFYVACYGKNDSWSSGIVYRSIDSGLSWSDQLLVKTEATMGVATTVLADGDAKTWDTANSVNISMRNGSLSSDTVENVLNGSNSAILGSELIHFTAATLEADGSYTLSGLLRGRIGTEHETSSHSIGDRFVLLNTATIYRVESAYSQFGVTNKYKAVTNGQFIDSVTSTKDVTFDNLNAKPLSVCQISGSRDGSNNLTINWIRRSRLSGVSLDDPALGEQSELYEVHVMDGAVVKRVIQVSTNTATYTASQQTLDGITPGDPVTLNIYQVSAAVGRGYVRSETL